MSTGVVIRKLAQLEAVQAPVVGRYGRATASGGLEWLLPDWSEIQGKPATFAPDLTAHLAAADPHPGYRLESVLLTDADVAAANKDGAAGVASLRTLGTGATQAASGNDSRITSAISQATADGLYPALAPASAARNTMQATADVPAQIWKARAAGQTSLTEWQDSGGDVGLRVTLPANIVDNSIGTRLDFPFVGPANPPSMVVGYGHTFSGTVNPIIAVGHNIAASGTTKLTAGKPTVGIWVEGDYNDGTNRLSEIYAQFVNDDATVSARPIFADFVHTATTRETAIRQLVLLGKSISFYCPKNSGGDAQIMSFSENAGAAEMRLFPPGDGRALLSLEPPANRESWLDLGWGGTATVARFQTVNATQAWIGFGAGGEIRMYKVGAGMAAAINAAENSATMTLANTLGGAWNTLTIRAHTAPSAPIVKVTNSAGSTQYWAIDQNGDMPLAEGTDIIVGTTTGTKIGTATNQKLAVYNATPIVQGAAVADPTGGAIIDIEGRTQLSALLARIRAFGIIAT